MIIPEDPPVFKEELEDFELLLGRGFVYVLPDVESKTLATINVNMGKAGIFSTYEAATQLMWFKHGATNEDLLGEYPIQIVLENESGGKSMYTMMLNIVAPEPVLETERVFVAPLYVAPLDDDTLVPAPSISSINNVGDVTIKFNKEMKPVADLKKLMESTVEVALDEYKPAIEVTIIPSGFSNSSLLNMTHNITSFGPTEMVI